ncbi:sigma-70 family RNA polymerase sigma factor [Gimesia sp.]|uniref:sigma-70 family RNA polymerase sigma factor n=1 Tax=Gimesia sp. TaxID=2024833 RepID=UPI003A949D9F
MYTRSITRQKYASTQFPDDKELMPPLDHRPFMRYYSAAYPHVYRYIYSLVPRKSDADEVMQETSVVLWQKFDEFQPDRDFTRWACGIARLVVLEVLRKQRRFIVGFDEQLIKELSIRREERYELLELRQEFLEECKGQLDQQDLNLLDLYYNSPESAQDAAEKKGCSRRNIYQQLGRIRKLLFQCIERKMSEDREA